MSRDNILYALIGVGFGLFFGLLFVVVANQRYAPAVAAAAADAANAPDDAAAQSSITVADRQRLESAAQATSQRARTDTNNYEAQMEAAQVSYQLQRFDDALEFLLRANQLQPDNIEPVVALGNVNYDAGRYQVAEKWYTAALVKEPNDVNVRTDLGLTYLLREPAELDRAITEFRRSLQADPRHEPTLQNLVVALTRKGDRAGAQAALQKLQEINPNNAALPQLRAGLDPNAAANTNSTTP